jgi:hypothetical protein
MRGDGISQVISQRIRERPEVGLGTEPPLDEGVLVGAG